MQTCQFCRFLRPYDETMEWGECRRTSPTCYPVVEEEGAVAWVTVWPEVEKSDYCHKYEAWTDAPAAQG